jgi:hypothetical protein
MQALIVLHAYGIGDENGRFDFSIRQSEEAHIPPLIPGLKHATSITSE